MSQQASVMWNRHYSLLEWYSVDWILNWHQVKEYSFTIMTIINVSLTIGKRIASLMQWSISGMVTQSQKILIHFFFHWKVVSVIFMLPSKGELFVLSFNFRTASILDLHLMHTWLTSLFWIFSFMFSPTDQFFFLCFRFHAFGLSRRCPFQIWAFSWSVLACWPICWKA